MKRQRSIVIPGESRHESTTTAVLLVLFAACCVLCLWILESRSVPPGARGDMREAPGNEQSPPLTPPPGASRTVEGDE